MEDHYSLDDLLDLTRNDRDGFWLMMYQKIKLAIQSGEDRATIFEITEEKPDDLIEVTSIVLDDNQFLAFLENFMVFSEQNEEYERCSEIKSIIEDYKKEQEFKRWQSD